MAATLSAAPASAVRSAPSYTHPRSVQQRGAPPPRYRHVELDDGSHLYEFAIAEHRGRVAELLRARTNAYDKALVQLVMSDGSVAAPSPAASPQPPEPVFVERVGEQVQNLLRGGGGRPQTTERLWVRVRVWPAPPGLDGAQLAPLDDARRYEYRAGVEADTELSRIVLTHHPSTVCHVRVGTVDMRRTVPLSQLRAHYDALAAELLQRTGARSLDALADNAWARVVVTLYPASHDAHPPPPPPPQPVPQAPQRNVEHDEPQQPQPRHARHHGPPASAPPHGSVTQGDHRRHQPPPATFFGMHNEPLPPAPRASPLQHAVPAHPAPSAGARSGGGGDVPVSRDGNLYAAAMRGAGGGGGGGGGAAMEPPTAAPTASALPTQQLQRMPGSGGAAAGDGDIPPLAAQDPAVAHLLPSQSLGADFFNGSMM